MNLQKLSNPEFFEDASGNLSSLGTTAEILDQKIWKEFDKTDFPNTEFAVSYMNEDDYDQTGYQDILKHLEGKKVRAYGKGITGRHNDNTTAVTNWFKHLYGRILQEDFGRS